MNWHAHLERLKTSVVGLGAKRLIALAVIGLISFSAVEVGAYIMSRSDMETLYGGLTQQDVTRIGAALREAGISFDVNMEGTKVLVRVGEAAQARMLLAEKGLPSSANAGYELFDKLGTLGLTSFMQEITRVQRPGRRDRAHHPGHEGRKGGACSSRSTRNGLVPATAKQPRHRQS